MIEQQTKTEALAKHLFRFGNPNLTGEEHDRLLGMWEEVDEMVRTVWMDLAEAAYAYLADEIDTVVEQHTNGRTAELGWDELVAAIPDGWELQESAQLEEVSRVRQRDLEASQATTARWRARAEKAEAELEKYHAEERRELEWDRFCAQQDVRCTECGLRYGERKDYTCPHIGEHKYDADELRAALEGKS